MTPKLYDNEIAVTLGYNLLSARVSKSIGHSSELTAKLNKWLTDNCEMQATRSATRSAIVNYDLTVSVILNI